MCIRYGVLSASLRMVSDLTKLEAWGEDPSTKALRVHMEASVKASPCRHVQQHVLLTQCARARLAGSSQLAAL